MKNRMEEVKRVQDLLTTHTVEELAKEGFIAGSYAVPETLVGVIVSVEAEDGYQYGCAHILTGHEKIQKISVKQTTGENKYVALYKVVKGKGELWHNGQITEIRKGDLIKLKNNDEYCMAGDLVVVEVFDPLFNETTHISLEENNPLLTPRNVGV